MLFTENDLREFIEHVTPLGKKNLEFLLYGLRTDNSAPFYGPSIARWPKDTAVTDFWLKDDPWPVVVELFEIHTPTLPEQYQERLSSALLELTEQGATLSWFMFDGGFGGVTHFFTPWEVEQTYGIAIPRQGAKLAISQSSRTDLSWAKLLAEASEYLYRKHPDLLSL
jgi:hypothetical protein